MKKNAKKAPSSSKQSLKDDNEKQEKEEQSKKDESKDKAELDSFEEAEFTDSDDFQDEKPPIVKSCPELMNCSSVADVLLAMEGKKTKISKDNKGSESESSDWEEVANAEELENSEKPSEEVNIKLSHIPGLVKKKTYVITL